MNFDDYESLPTSNTLMHMLAGSVSGMVEHGVMYPLDTVKTRMQSLDIHSRNSIITTFRTMIQTEGLIRPLRGIATVLMGAGPAHALYFGSYERSKHILTQYVNPKFDYVVNGLSGGIASMIHDAVSNPIEVIKQRMQIFGSPYSGVYDCITTTFRTEGWRAFYKSFGVQVTMNLPFQTVHFVTYEAMQNWLNEERNYNPKLHAISGAMAGGTAAAFTNPLDVLKTVINTQVPKTTGVFDAVYRVFKTRGVLGFFYGIQARVLYHMPAAAICWSTYETLKHILIPVEKHEQH